MECEQRPRNPQLALYAQALGVPLAAVAYAQLTARDCGFVTASEDPALFGKPLRCGKLEGPGSMREELALWMQRIAVIASELERGYAAVTPQPGACGTCNLSVLCRVGAAAEREEPTGAALE